MFYTLLGFAQQQIEELGETLVYKTRFYGSNTEVLLNTQLCYTDSIVVDGKRVPQTFRFFVQNLDSSVQIDVDNCVKDGLWKEYFNRKWEPTDSSKYKYFTLKEYGCGVVYNRTYSFTKKGQLLSSFLAYPVLNGEEYDGIQRIDYYPNEKIKSVDYTTFSDDTTTTFYMNTTYYHENGTIRTYYIDDELNNFYESGTITEKGYCIEEHFRNGKIGFTRKEKRNKEIITQTEDGHLYKIIKKNGIEIKRKMFW
jgi:hypothetical protein